MPAPRVKRTSNSTYERILAAITEMAQDDDAPRTKREIERRSGLGHDPVARAFRQDAQEDNQFHINKAFDALSDDLSTTTRVSPERDKQLATQRQNLELRDQIRHLNNQLDRHAMALFAFHLRDIHPARTDKNTQRDIVPIRGRQRDEN